MKTGLCAEYFCAISGPFLRVRIVWQLGRGATVPALAATRVQLAGDDGVRTVGRVCPDATQP